MNTPQSNPNQTPFPVHQNNPPSKQATLDIVETVKIETDACQPRILRKTKIIQKRAKDQVEGRKNGKKGKRVAKKCVTRFQREQRKRKWYRRRVAQHVKQRKTLKQIGIDFQKFLNPIPTPQSILTILQTLTQTVPKLPSPSPLSCLTTPVLPHRKQNFLKHLSYLTYTVLQNGSKMSFKQIVDSVLAKEGELATGKQLGNVRKRIYDVLNIFQRVGVLEKGFEADGGSGNKGSGKVLRKKDRVYGISGESRGLVCMRAAHAQKLIQLLKARRDYKTQMLIQMTNKLLALRKAKSRYKKAQHSKNQFHLGQGLLAFFCPIVVQDHKLVSSEGQPLTFKMSQDKRKVTIKFRTTRSPQFMQYTDILSNVFLIKNGKNPIHLPKLHQHSHTPSQPQPQIKTQF